ncbi:MAG: tetratricopeptide repeat protein, partial [bacterium]
RILPPLLLVLVCVVVYANGLQGGFVYDDVAVTITDNPFLSGLVGWKEVLTWDRPVREFTYLFDHALWGERPFGYHLQNLFWHVLNVLLIWRIQREMRIDPWHACLGALLFAVHPINTEAVTWISGRKELLCLFFELCAVWLFLRFLRTNVNPFGYSLAVVLSLCLALFSKQVAVVLPLLLIAAAWTEGGISPLPKRRILFLLSIVMLGTAFLALTSLRAVEVAREALQRGTYYDPSARHLELEHPILTGFAVWWSAVRLLVIPYPLIVERTIDPVTSWADPRWILGIMIVAASLAFLWSRKRRGTGQPFGIAWILITWLPTSGLLPATYLLADRYLYIPCAGFCIFAAYCFADLFHQRTTILRRAGVAVVTVVLAGYALLTVGRNLDWADETALWESAALYESSNPKIQFNLGNAYYSEGLTERAEEEWKQALSLRPQYPEVHINLGTLYQKEGKWDLARFHYQEALKISPYYGIAEFNLASLYQETGNREEAIRMMRSAAAHIEGKRDTLRKKAAAYKELARLLMESERLREALAAAKQSLEYNPHDPDAKTLASDIESCLVKETSP